MTTVNLSALAEDTQQLSMLNSQIATVTDPTIKTLLQLQAAQLTAKIQAEAAHAQNQIDATNNFLDNFELQTTLQGVLSGAGTALPAIIGLFRK